MDKKKIRLQNLSHQDWSGADLKNSDFQCNLTEKMSLSGAQMQAINAHAAAFTTVNFSEADLSNAVDITGAFFHGCNLEKTNLSGANLSGTLFYQCNLKAARFSNSQLRAATFLECTLDSAIFSGALLEQATFNRCTFVETDFSSARAKGAQFTAQCRFHKTNFSEADLAQVNMNTCEGEDVNFAKSNLNAAYFYNVNFNNARFHGSCADDMSVLSSSLKECGFSDLDKGVFKARALVIRDSSLRGSDFSGAYLYRAQITGDYLSLTQLQHCNFEGANLVNSLIVADLRSANFKNANAEYAHLSQCDCIGANFSGTQLRGASFVKCKLSEDMFKPSSEAAWMDRCEPKIQKRENL